MSEVQTTETAIGPIVGIGAGAVAPTEADPCEECPHFFEVTPRPGIPDGRYCAVTSCRANARRCFHRHLPAHAAGLTVLRGA